MGWIAGKMMAWSNTGINDLALEALDVQSGDQVLEIGFGSGTTLPVLANQAGDGFGAGVEPSDTMIGEASNRVKQQIAAGQVELKSGSVSNIPYADGRFDRVLSVNNVYFWEQPASDLKEIRRVLKPGGRFALVFRTVTEDDGVLHLHSMPDAPSVDEVTGWVRDARFTDVGTQERDVNFIMSTVRGVAIVATATENN